MSKLAGYQIAPEDLFTEAAKMKMFGEEYPNRQTEGRMDDVDLLAHLQDVLNCEIACVQPRKENATDEECRFVFIPKGTNHQSGQEPQEQERESFKKELAKRKVKPEKLEWVHLDMDGFRQL